MAERNWRARLIGSLPDRTDIVVWRYDPLHRIFTVAFSSAPDTFLDLDSFTCIPASIVQATAVTLDSLVADGKSLLDLRSITSPTLGENYQSIGWISGYGEFCGESNDLKCVIVLFSKYQNFFRKQSHAKLASTVIRSVYDRLLYSSELDELKSELKRVTENILAIHTAAMAQEFLHEIKNELLALQSHFEGTFSFLKTGNDTRAAKEYRLFVDSIYSLQQRSTNYLRRTETDDLHLYRRDILATLAEAVKTNSVRAQQNHVTLRNLCIGQPVVLPHDQLRMTEAFKNIIRNAIDAANPKAKGEKYVEITLDRRPGEVTFHFRDNGTGFRVEPETLFRPGYSTKRRGTGLGLAISQSIVEKHHGRISARDIGGGSVFSVTIPFGIDTEIEEA